MIPFSVLFPYRFTGIPEREDAADWIQRRWAALVPEAEVVVMGDDGGESPGHFNHPLCINRAAKMAAHDILFVCDADTAFDAEWARQAVQAVADGAPWVMARYYHTLTQDYSAWLVTQPVTEPIRPSAHNIEWTGDCQSVAGFIVMPRAGFVAVAGYDERFTWWGSDDVANCMAMDTLWGKHQRLEGHVYHLWHPVDTADTYGNPRNADQYELTERYKAAYGDPVAMREVRFG